MFPDNLPMDQKAKVPNVVQEKGIQKKLKMGVKKVRKVRVMRRITIMRMGMGRMKMLKENFLMIGIGSAMVVIHGVRVDVREGGICGDGIDQGLGGLFLRNEGGERGGRNGLDDLG